MFWLIILLVVVAAGLLPYTIVSGTVGAVLGAKAQKAAAERTAQAQENNNAQQIAFQKQLLGADGMPVWLPWYAKDQEQKIFQGTTGAYNALTNGQGTPEQQLARYQAIAGQYAGLPGQATSDITSGQYLSQQLADQAPVSSARSAVATGQKEGVLEGLSERLNQLKADSGRQGFTGGGSFANNRMLGATIGARQAAAGAISGANLQNSLDVQRIRNANQQLKSQTQFQAPDIARGALSLQAMPQQLVAQNYANAQSLFNPFKRPGSGPLAIQAPQYSASASPWQLLAQNTAALGSQALGAYFKSPQGQGLLGGGSAAGAAATNPETDKMLLSYLG